jgi:hypothetical protein
MTQVADTAAKCRLTSKTVFHMKVSGISLAWYKRWRLEPGQRSWAQLVDDFTTEAAKERTVCSSITEALQIKMQANEVMNKYRMRMKVP